MLIIHERQAMSDFMLLLMKRRNSRGQWTTEEVKRIKSDLKHLSLYVPVLIIFALPFGSLLLPFLAKILDRRKTDRSG
jgi:hypothetical protein